MGVEGCNHIVAFLVTVNLLDLVLLAVIKKPFHGNWFHWPFLFKTVQVFASPWKSTLVFRCDIDCFCRKRFSSAICFVNFVVSFTLLVFSQLVNKYWEKSQLSLHFIYFLLSDGTVVAVNTIFFVYIFINN
jgi:hypothetical protein